MDKNRIKQLIGHEDPIFFEIGANNGSDTQGFLDLFEKGRFFCFEPDPRAYKKLIANVNDYRCSIFNYAISDTTGTAEFNMSGGWPDDFPGTGDWDMSGSLKKPKNHIPLHPWCTFDKKINVKTVTLDDIYYTHLFGKPLPGSATVENYDPVIDFIWQDVQGCEENVIKGAPDVFSTCVKYLYTEYSDKELYEGEATKEKILEMLPNFELIEDFGTDILLYNRRADV